MFLLNVMTLKNIKYGTPAFICLGVKNKRLKAGLDDDYMIKVLTVGLTTVWFRPVCPKKLLSKQSVQALLQPQPLVVY